MEVFLIVSVFIFLASFAWIVLLIATVTKKAKNKKIAERYFRIFLSITFIVLFSSCGPGKEFKRNNRYLVTVETNKPKKIKVVRFPESEKVDSVVTRNFGHAIKDFKSDSIFNSSYFFRIETLNRAVYGEEKEVIIPKRRKR